LITHHFADLPNRMRLHYAAAGAGPLVLLLHGFPEFWYEWKVLLAELGRARRAIAPDLRGYNLSSKPPTVEDYRAWNMVEDIRLLADHLGVERFALVAHDWGGAVAWSFAAAHPDRLQRLVVINAPHPLTFARELRDSPAQRQASAYMTLFRSAKAERVLSENNYARLQRMTLDTWAANGAVASDEDRRAYLDAWSQPGALTGSLNYYRASPLHPPEPCAAPAAWTELDAAALHVRVPTRVIWGERDQALLTGNLEGLDAHVDRLEIVRIPEGSHWIVHEQPERVGRLVGQFLD
jgi:pimeloyl-ACP methyl ester carboxylesterase